MPCPRCGQTIPVGEQDRGWVRTEISTIFEHPNAAARRPEDQPRPQPEAEPEPEKPRRKFQDVTQVKRPALGLGEESSAPSEETEEAEQEALEKDHLAQDGEEAGTKTKSPSLAERLKKIDPKRLRRAKTGSDSAEVEAHEEALEDALEADLLTIADEAVGVLDEEEPEPAPESEPEPEPEPESEREAPSVAQKTRATSPTRGGVTSASVEEPPAPESEPEPEPEPEAKPPPPPPKPEPEVRLAEADHAGPWSIRVDEVAYDPVDEEALATLLKTGVWIDVVELQTEAGPWIPLRQHPAYPEVHERLLRQTQQIVEKVSTGEWEREPLSGAIPVPQTPGEHNEEPTPRTEAPVEDDVVERGPTWLRPVLVTLAIVAAFAVGAALTVALVDSRRTDRTDQTEQAAAAKPPEVEAPVLTTPPPSEPTGEDWRRAVERAKATVATAHRADTLAHTLIDLERYEGARKTVLDAMIERGVRPPFRIAYNDAIAADPALHPDTVTLGVDEQIDGIHALGGGRSISLRMTRGGKSVYAFKPAQKEWGEGWRAEVAAYLFCEFVPCHFEVPRNRPARISRERFDTLYAKVEGDWQDSYAERFADLSWVEEEGPDGQRREYLYGTLKDWVPHFVDWPIEYTSVWKNLLDVRFHPANLQEPYEEVIEPLETLGEGQFYRDARNEQGDASTRSVARQLSAILVFDYLTQNWDRFSKMEAYYGVNNQFSDGTFISLDNGAAFYDEPVPEIEPRIELVSRFSRSTITAIRALSPRAVNEVLFGDPGPVERRRLELFWQQRDKLLDRVDTLVQKYGAARVYEFR